MIQEFIEDFGKYLPAQVVPAIVGFFSIPIITRLFPPADYGNYILVIATVSILTAITGWLSRSIIRFYPVYERDGKLNEFYSTIIKWLFISISALAFIFLIVVFATKHSLTNQLYYLMLIGTLVFISSAFFETLQHFIRAKRKVSWYSVFSLWKSITTLGIGIALVIGFKYGIEGLLWGAVLSSVIALPLLWKFSIGGASFGTKGISLELTKEMGGYSFPLVAAGLSAWILSLSDRYVLEFFRGAHEVGIYSVSYAISEYSILLLASLFMLSGGPIGMIVWEKEGVEKSQEFVSKVTRYYLLVILPAVVGLSVLAKPLIGIFVAQEYYEGHIIVPLVTVGVFLLGLRQRFQSGLIYYKKTYLSMFCVISSALLNLGLNFLLIPKYGYKAAAITTLVSYATLLVLEIVISRRFFVWKFPFRTLGKATCASGVMGIMVYLIGSSLTLSPCINLITGVCVGVVIYFLIIVLLGELRQDEIQAMLSLKGNIFR